MNRPKIFVMMGLPGSGKSYQSELLSKEYNANIHSSDQLRQELLDDINDQSNNDLVFRVLHKRIKEDLSNGINCVYDACNITRKSRMNILRELSKIDCEKICVFMATPYEQCLINNQERDRTIPEEVIKRMYLKFNPPGLYEGFDDIKIVYWENSQNSLAHSNFIKQTWESSQYNHHHSLSIGRHCFEAATQVFEHYQFYNLPVDADVVMAALLHDEGKILTRDFHNAKGEPTKEAHYFSHNNVGSYNSFFYDFDANHLYVAQLIDWHMRPYLAWEQSEKSKEKDRRLLGDKMYNDILLLHKADLAAH